MSNPEKKDVGAPVTAPEPAPASDAGAKSAAPKVNQTIQLDLAQVDLLDVPLPPSSSPKVEGAHDAAAKASKGPPPLPPPLPPEPAAAAAAAVASPTPQPPAAVSARKLLEQTPPSGNPALRFALGLGVATIVCVGLWFGLKSLRKPPAAAAPPVAAASAGASAAPSAEPIRTITIAPIEMTGPALSASEDKPAASAPSSKPSAAPATTTHPPAAGSGKPRAGDDLIKVEN